MNPGVAALRWGTDEVQLSSGLGDRLPSDKVAALHRIGWQESPEYAVGLVRALPQAHHGTVRSLTAWRLCGASRGTPAHGHGHATSRMVTRCAGGIREEGKGGAVVTALGWQ